MSNDQDITPLPTNEETLLRWLVNEDGQYGECYGATLNGLIVKGYAVIGGVESGIHNSFIAKGTGLMYRAVSITDAGRAALGLQGE